MKRFLPTRTEILIGIAVAAALMCLLEYTEHQRIEGIKEICKVTPDDLVCFTLTEKELHDGQE